MAFQSSVRTLEHAAGPVRALCFRPAASYPPRSEPARSKPVSSQTAAANCPMQTTGLLTALCYRQRPIRRCASGRRARRLPLRDHGGNFYSGTVGRRASTLPSGTSPSRRCCRRLVICTISAAPDQPRCVPWDTRPAPRGTTPDGRPRPRGSRPWRPAPARSPAPGYGALRLGCASGHRRLLVRPDAWGTRRRPALAREAPTR